MKYNFHADDAHVYLIHAVDTTINKVAACVEQVYLWMAKTHLKLNDDKIEVMNLGTKQQWQWS